jgi:molecular chaperone HscB
MRCPHCQSNVTGTEFCPECGRILPLNEKLSPYVTLGFEQERLVIDRGELDRKLFELSKKFHPDRFVSKTPLEVELAHEWSAAVNNAYRTLKDPILRAKYWVERQLGSIEEKSAHVPPEMAELFFEVQDQLETIRDSDGTPPASAIEEVRKAEADLRKEVISLEKQLESVFQEYDAQPDEKKIVRMKDILSERSYMKSFLRQIDEVLNRED